ncbi:MAG: reprolysin-like metallopeptidase [Bacteroidota bacterium]
MKFKLVLLLLTLYYVSFGQNTLDVILDKHVEEQESSEEFLFVPALPEIKAKLSSAPRFDDGQQWVRMKIPFADGTYHEVEVAEAPVVADELYYRYPQNRSYKVRGVNDNFISGRMAITDLGMTALIFTESDQLFIEPTENKYHKAYNYDRSLNKVFACGTDHTNHKTKKQSSTRDSYGSNERKYDIAIASTGEFSAEYGNDLAAINAAISTYLTLLNTLYERDLAITFELIADNDDIIFFNPATDGIDPTNNTTRLNTTQSVINSTIGSANYDIGHAFYEMPPPSGGWWGSGVATLGTVCSSSTKARGWTGCGGSYPTSFWMEIFAHEVGHQFDATHTFYGTSGNCAGSQRSVGNGVEPGSGNSLMSYEGNCGASGSCSNHNITPQVSFQYFHAHNIAQIQNFVSNEATCNMATSTGNSPPVITMPAAQTIPKETPFMLSATATDPDGDPLLLSWEEVDTDNLSLSCPNGAPNDAATSTTAPLFRSFEPSSNGATRYFPQLSDILDDTQTQGEILPEVGRTIDMRFSARGTDANGISGISYEDVTITVDGNSGPFEVTSISTPTAYLAGESVNIIWAVNNTNQAPVSCSNVNILFSNDGGMTFPITLLAGTPNDGNQSVTMPGSATESGRIKVEADGNIFFSINKGDITIISDCDPSSSTIFNDDDVTADVGDPALDLGLILGEVTTSVSGTLESSDPSMNLTSENTTNGSCFNFNNYAPRYESIVLEATETDVYNFSMSASFTDVANIYSNTFNPNSTCQNWLASSLLFNSSSGSASFTNNVSVSLNEGDIIEMVLSGFASNSLGSYTVTLSSNSSGSLFSTPAIPAGFTYKWVIYNSSGTIMGIEDEADLTDGSTYVSDVYTVIGLMAYTSTNFASYVGGTFSSLQSNVLSGTVCGEFSSNDVRVTINGCSAGIKMVTSAQDNSSMGTLRYLVENGCDGDVIQFSPSLMNSTIVLNSEILIAENMTINGLGMNNFTLSGNNASRIFSIQNGVNVSISDLSLINGFASSNGGAFLNNGTLQLNNIKFVGNNNGAFSKAFTNLGTISVVNTVNVED